MATAILDDDKSEAERLSYIRSAPEAAAVVSEWAPGSALRIDARVYGGGAAIPAGTLWPSFRGAAVLMAKIGELGNVGQEELRDFIGVAQAVLSVSSDFPKWADAMLQAACSL
eukprot:4216907-Pyramimonas_sp.AAC.1